MIKNLIKLADHLDRKGLSKEASYVDDLIKKFSNYEWDLIRQSINKTINDYLAKPIDHPVWEGENPGRWISINHSSSSDEFLKLEYDARAKLTKDDEVRKAELQKKIGELGYSSNYLQSEINPNIFVLSIKL